MDDRIHPAVRISLLLIGATATSLGNYFVLATAFAVVAFCYCVVHPSAWRQGLRMLKAMRWFFLSIVVVYFWFTPGQAILTNSHSGLLYALSPSYEGLELGLHRVLILVLILFMVNFLLQTTCQSRLLLAIYWWLRPLEFVGVNTKRISLRISLVLSLLPQARDLIDEVRQSIAIKSDGMNKPQLIGVAIGEVICQVEQRATQPLEMEIELPEVDNPPQLQWLLPLSLIGVVFLLQIMPAFIWPA